MQEHPEVSSAQPLRALGMMVDKNVVVKLKAGRVLGGVLRFIDQCMNIVLDEAEELDSRTNQVTVKYGRVLIRGNQVLYVSLRNELE
ncbi:MAG: U6 snRNA-associated Sm-like protein LSm6 [Caldivirga sp.]|jgi:small nuclear ribonucleoprotein|uniref:U6 snRNA-associated Sm-like protein LSm6 n=1 Tax=Caldivirga sp. MU80 TaxID=1650354 RepID=UPI000835A815|nr:U6 snRNA-associated Sm-like protein LSm6 [Caldivirga sp. MU80]